MEIIKYGNTTKCDDEERCNYNLALRIRNLSYNGIPVFFRIEQMIDIPASTVICWLNKGEGYPLIDSCLREIEEDCVAK